MKRTLILVMCIAALAHAQDSRQEYRRHIGVDTLSFGTSPGKYMYSYLDSLYFRGSSGTTTRISPSSAITGSGTYRYVPLFNGTSTLTNSNLRLGVYNGDIELVGNGSTRRLNFVEDGGVTDSGYVFLNTTTSLPPWLDKGLVIGSAGYKGVTVFGPLRVASGTLGVFDRIRAKVYAGDIDSGTISAARLPAAGGSVGTFTNATVTIDQYGRVISAADGVAQSSGTNNTNTIAGRAVDSTSRVVGTVLMFNGTSYYHKKGVDASGVTAGYVPYASSDTILTNSPVKVISGKDVQLTGSGAYPGIKLYDDASADSGWVKLSDDETAGIEVSELKVTKRARGTVSTISASAIDWADNNFFTKSISTSTTFTFSNVPTTGGQAITVRLINSGAYTVSWPGTVKWAGNSAPVQTTGSKTDVYTFVAIAGTVYGSVVQNFSN